MEMNANLSECRTAIRRFRALRDGNVSEAVLRAEFQSRLRSMFPDPGDSSWINHYTQGVEAPIRVNSGRGIARRFVDNLVGSTIIEYESDLRLESKRRAGLAQLREQVLGLLRKGIPAAQIRAVLSDTVDWYVYDVKLHGAAMVEPYSAEDVELELVDQLSLAADDDYCARNLVHFLRKHLAREQSRALRADFLVLDLGLESETHQRAAAALTEYILQARQHDPSVALATDLWSRFVDYLEAGGGNFRVEAYADEVYFVILARLLSANLLAGKALRSHDTELKSILNGYFFRENYQLENFVERDYFGWMVEEQHIDRILPVAREIQEALVAYDYGGRVEDDLFGRLLSQLATRSRRKLLGQEWTPGWLAHALAERCIAGIPEGELPRIIDVCCGTGTILAAVIEVARRRRDIRKISELKHVATGFDIDPVAVTFAKTTWVATLREEIKEAKEPVFIPIYHADSLFVVTPVSGYVPLPDEADIVEVELDGRTVGFPMGLLQPELRDLFNRIIDWAYDEAQHARETGVIERVTEDDAERFLSANLDFSISADLRRQLISGMVRLVRHMSELAAAGRNGIWAFILRNTYSPGLLAGRFNGLASNPPWLAMSAVGNNPYREALEFRAEIYGLKPKQQSAHHLELATIHLLHAVDRYLEPGASVACVLPGTIFNGDQHEPFRQRRYLTSGRRVPLKVREIWQVAPGTFKYPGAVVIGRKVRDLSQSGTSEIMGYVASQQGMRRARVSIRCLEGRDRTAWVLEDDDEPKAVPAASCRGGSMPHQGADLMPRPAVCVEVVREGNREHRVRTPVCGSFWHFAIQNAKKLKGVLFSGYVAPRFIYRMAQSVNLLPFCFDGHHVRVAIPAVRDGTGNWVILKESEIRRKGFIGSARYFAEVNRCLRAANLPTLQERIDTRGKLSKQVFPERGWLVLSGAGGEHICAACISVDRARDIIIDQTLYWQVVDHPDEAWYMVGMLNSPAMTEAVLPFNPKGEFGGRHIHTTPYRLMPQFSAANEDHREIAALARKLAAVVESLVRSDPYLADPARPLENRRRKVRRELESTTEFRRLEGLCARILGTTPVLEPEQE